MPVSTDGVLLGSWAKLEASKNLLDIGTGTGLLSLMCAQRNASLTIDAIEIDSNALQAAQSNFAQSPWSDRIQLHSGDVLTRPFHGKFDTIICNPPYFNSGEQTQNISRATARHTNSLSHEDLLQCCWDLLTDQGYASFVLPKVEGDAFIDLAKQQGWSLQRLCQVRPTEYKEVSRLLIQLGKQSTSAVLTTLTIHDNGGYSSDFIRLTKAFYLKM
ncbi:tRNA (adenine-N(6)-)-methyltransferase [Vibrio orientalis CIP 102891 = ATCC 33934]|uniref:tRNA1(Val) (adenine(37)-N6)-methyltransferase n=1 Tax=Vibrio orientalis CIP 102891 = ATCC 33934 TaxID=675816 RepID=C9QC97_VIBOR|nr:predicted O-methyltransferase [Vibrio orientalis CIP 102891 = ATCC 33934]EGU49819.1 tRNA (adenine-N(6)-)-methyltransferase [Vibrio orientalis CIP 102891 = ATCC 33934]